MQTWAWLGAYVVGFALLQFYLYRYFMNRGSTGTESSQGTAAGVSDGGARSRSSERAPDGVDRQNLARCGNCGAYNRNDTMFVYCKECGERMS